MRVHSRACHDSCMATDGDALVSEIKSILDELDPEGLLAMGAPRDDEYLPEARDFAARIRRGETITGEVVLRVWVGWFSSEGSLARSDLADVLAGRLGALKH